MRKAEQYALADAVARLEALCDAAGDQCGVAPEHKRAVQLYVESYVTPYVRMALESGITGRSIALASIYRGGKGGCATMAGAKLVNTIRRDARNTKET